MKGKKTKQEIIQVTQGFVIFSLMHEKMCKICMSTTLGRHFTQY